MTASPWRDRCRVCGHWHSGAIHPGGRVERVVCADCARALARPRDPHLRRLQEADDWRAPMRGLLSALLFSVPIWAAIGLLYWLITH